ncbi:MAG: Na+/H+ antiporter NhaA [Gemmatimonadaceae bacterium]|nr:Na+/H+ antiporter NhaA [Gemmatimonadaceae bacterium]
MPAKTRPVLAARLSRPFQRFSAWNAGGGIVLLVSAVVAIVLANTAWHGAVESFWQTPLSLGIGASTFVMPLRTVISDGLMAVFFLLVGLEIKGELLVGSLSTVRTAALPLAGALGGMLVPAAIYAFVNRGAPSIHGWGIPTATDIAFALGILAMLGSRVPSAVLVFLSALAIADDLGAVLIISLFYGHAPDIAYLSYAGLVMVLLLVSNLSGVAWRSVYALLGLCLWYFVLRSGVHSTVAGVLLAAMVPARSRIEATRFEETVERRLDDFARATGDDARPVLSNGGQQRALAAIEEACEDAQPPLAHLRHQLHVPVNFYIMPCFALANAGVSFTHRGPAPLPLVGTVSIGIILGLVIGKPLGILLGSWIATRLGAELPAATSWTTMAGVSCLAGIGFTMSLFVSGLAFPSSVLLEQAKFGIVIASILAGSLGASVIWAATATRPLRSGPPLPSLAD